LLRIEHLKFIVFNDLHLVAMAGHFLNTKWHTSFDPAPKQGLPPVPKAFRENEPQHAAFMAPVRFEGEITDLEIIGDVPEEISGTLYRVMPEPHYPSFVENDPVSSFT
jgi:hypothetical protein